jgi:hypothetical protein
VGAAKARAGRLPRFAGAACASLRLPCDARSRGPVAELASFASLTALKQLRRVRQQLALRARPRALRFSALQRRATACPHAPLLTRFLFASKKHRRWVSGRRHPAGAMSVATRSTTVQSERSADRPSLSPRQVPPSATLGGYALLNGQMQTCVRPRPRGRTASPRRRPCRGRASSGRAGSSGTAATVCDCPAWAASRRHAARSPR